MSTSEDRVLAKRSELMEARISSTLEFVGSLDIETELREDTLELMQVDQKPQGYIAAGSLISFVANLHPQNQRDVLNSTLLAQLAANRKFNREVQTVEWYQFYRTVLENIGWVVPAFSFDKLDTAGSQLTVDKVVLDILAAIATGNEMAIVKKTIDAMKALDEGDGRLRLFERSSHSLRQGNFQIGLATDAGGVVAMRLGTFYFTTTNNVTRVLWFKFSSASASFYNGAQTMNLNAQIYDRVREAVVDKLGDAAETFVEELEI